MGYINHFQIRFKYINYSPLILLNFGYIILKRNPLKFTNHLIKCLNRYSCQFDDLHLFYVKPIIFIYLSIMQINYLKVAIYIINCKSTYLGSFYNKIEILLKLVILTTKLLPRRHKINVKSEIQETISYNFMEVLSFYKNT